MTLGRVITISVLLLGFSTVSFALEPIDGAFGQRLGAYFDPAIATEIGEMTFGREKAYHFKPADPYPGLETYYVLLTPITHRVYGINAQSANYYSDDVCKNEQDILMKILRKKYGPSNDPDKRLKDCWIFCYRTFSISRGSRSVESTCQVSDNLIVRYKDDILEKQSAKEYERLDAKTRESNLEMKNRHVEQEIKTRNTKGF